jgi:hypothetical protein
LESSLFVETVPKVDTAMSYQLAVMPAAQEVFVGGLETEKIKTGRIYTGRIRVFIPLALH